MQYWQRKQLAEWLRIVYGLSQAEATLLVQDDEDAMFVHELVVNARETGKSLRRTREAVHRLASLVREFRNSYL